MADAATHIAKYAPLLHYSFPALPRRSLTLHREAKGLQQDLKELLKKNDLFDKEIDIKRKKCVHCTLRLVLL